MCSQGVLERGGNGECVLMVVLYTGGNWECVLRRILEGG